MSVPTPDGLPADHPFAGGSAAERMRLAMEQATREGSPRRDAVRRLAAAMRLANERLVRSNAEAGAIEEVAEAVERAVALLGEGPLNRPYEGVSEPSLAGSAAEDRSFFEYSPLFGKGNAIAPPLEIWTQDDAVHATAVFTAPYEGPPGHVHGGFIAAAFDEVLGMAQSLTGNPGMTGRLTIHYRSPTPLYQELRFKGWVTSVQGRKILTQATLDTHDGRRCAEAEGLFISIDFSRFARLLEERRTDQA
jgi:acyl-coenzyme A thioesterase PaaI-like protein